MIRIIYLVLLIIVINSCVHRKLASIYVTGDDIVEICFESSDSSFIMPFPCGICDTIFGDFFLKRNNVILYPMYAKVYSRKCTIIIDSISIRFIDRWGDKPYINWPFTINGIEYKTDSLGRISFYLKKGKEQNFIFESPLVTNGNFSIQNYGGSSYDVEVQLKQNINKETYKYKIRKNKLIQRLNGRQFVYYAKNIK